MRIEVAMVFPSNAVIDPGTMVVELVNTTVAYVAVATAGQTKHFTKWT